jgi:hypothetical protein
LNFSLCASCIPLRTLGLDRFPQTEPDESPALSLRESNWTFIEAAYEMRSANLSPAL